MIYQYTFQHVLHHLSDNGLNRLWLYHVITHSIARGNQSAPPTVHGLDIMQGAVWYACYTIQHHSDIDLTDEMLL